MALRGFQERKMLRKAIFSVPAAIVLWAIIFWTLWHTVALWRAKIKISEKNAEMTQDIKNTKESRENLEQKIESLRSEYGIDLEARSKFNLTKPGEKVVIFGEDKKSTAKEGESENFFGSVINWATSLFKNNE